jgi:hypothetical protein
MGAPSLQWLEWWWTDEPMRRVIDDANLLPPGVRDKAEEYTRQIFAESDVDVRVVLLRGSGGESLESLAPDLMRRLDAGAEGRRQRGLLVVYDAETRNGRIEVGYGLEEHFPDGLVGYLLANHVKTLFAAGDPTQGLHLLLRMMHHRIREAVLDQSFDPRIVDVLDDGRALSGGAGASRAMPLAEEKGKPSQPTVSDKVRARLGPQQSPEAAYRAYVSWLAAGVFDPAIGLFTPETRSYLANLPITRGYFQYILLQEYGQQFEIVTDRALLVFTSTPLVSPHFFFRSRDGWHVDLVAEVANTANIGGGIYTWTYRGSDDPYTNRFADELIKIGNYLRLVRGDNRKLPIRNPENDPSARSARAN